MIHLADRIAVLLVGLAVLWFFVTSSWFINPTFVSIEGRKVEVSRTFPASEWFGPPRVSYVETVRPFSNTTICQDVLLRPVQYRDNPANIGRWELGAWADECLTGEPFV